MAVWNVRHAGTRQSQWMRQLTGRLQNDDAIDQNTIELADDFPER